MNPYKEALKEPGNLIGVATVVAAAAALVSPLPVLIGVVAEAAWLLFAPETPWYQSRLRARMQSASNAALGGAVDAQQRDSLLAALPPELQQRYQRLARIRVQIEQKVRAQVSFTPEVLSKLDRLLAQFLDFCTTEMQFRTYLQNLVAEQGGPSMDFPTVADRYVPPSYARPNSPQTRASRGAPVDLNDISAHGGSADQWAQWAVGRIQQRFSNELNKLDPDSETDPTLKELKQKRVDVLTRRSEYVGRFGKALVNLSMQLQLIEDTFGLINDEVSTRSPDQVVGEIDNLMMQTDTLTKSLQEVGELYARAGVGG